METLVNIALPIFSVAVLFGFTTRAEIYYISNGLLVAAFLLGSLATKVLSLIRPIFILLALLMYCQV